MKPDYHCPNSPPNYMIPGCRFCPTTQLHITADLEKSVLLGCKSCNCVHSYDKVSGNLMMYYLSLLHNGKFYRGVFDLQTNVFQIIHIGGINVGWKTLLTLKYLPQGITPLNFKDKLGMLIVFS